MILLCSNIEIHSINELWKDNEENNDEEREEETKDEKEKHTLDRKIETAEKKIAKDIGIASAEIRAFLISFLA